MPSPQLAGTPQRATLDLNVPAGIGVRTVGRLVGLGDGKAQFSGSLANHCAMADLKQNRLLARLDAGAAERGAEAGLPPWRPEPTRVEARPRLKLDLARHGIRSVIWATGFRPDHSWLHVPPAFDHKGRLRHDGGVAAAPGIYVLGLPFLRRRKSSYIHGTGDARELAAHLGAHPARATSASARTTSR